MVNSGASSTDVHESEESLKDTLVQRSVVIAENKCDLQVYRSEKFWQCYGNEADPTGSATRPRRSERLSGGRGDGTDGTESGQMLARGVAVQRRIGSAAGR